MLCKVISRFTHSMITRRYLLHALQLPFLNRLMSNTFRGHQLRVSFDVLLFNDTWSITQMLAVEWGLKAVQLVKKSEKLEWQCNEINGVNSKQIKRLCFIMKYSQPKLNVDTFNARFGKAIMLPGFEYDEVGDFDWLNFWLDAWISNFMERFFERKSLSFYNFQFSVRLFSWIIIVFFGKKYPLRGSDFSCAWETNHKNHSS